MSALKAYEVILAQKQRITEGFWLLTAHFMSVIFNQKPKGRVPWMTIDRVASGHY
jgi:hypothetical protein